jgi:hypothetical protein
MKTLSNGSKVSNLCPKCFVEQVRRYKVNAVVTGAKDGKVDLQCPQCRYSWTVDAANVILK